MRDRIKQKPIVAVLLPILFLLVALISVYQWNPLKADDQNAHLVDVKVNGKEIDKNYSVTEQGTLLEMSTEEPQVLKFLESDKYKVELLNEKGEPLLSEEISDEKLKHYQQLVASNQKSTEQTDQSSASSDSSTTQQSTSKEVEEIASQLFYVVEDEKKIPYLLLDKEETIWLSVVNKKPEEATSVVLEKVDANKKQTLINFEAKKKETSESSKKEKESSSGSKKSSENNEKQESVATKNSSTSQEAKKDSSESQKKETTSSSKEPAKKSATKTKATKLTKEEKKRNLAIEQLLDEKYEEKDSFKPIELPAEGASIRETRSGESPISVTGAKMKIQTGTDYVDTGNDNPGYDSSFDNDLVRSFDSVIYLLTFSLEANDPTTTYSEIKYRVDMELPDAYALDNSGKQRFNAEVVDNENGELVGTSATTKTSKGYVESTIDANGQVLLPMFVNVYGAQHGTVIKPTMKITIISAKNDKTGEIEEVDKTYDESNMPDVLKLKETKVSAKPSVTANLTKGNKMVLGEFVSYYAGNTEWDCTGIGVTLGLKPISGRPAADFRGSTFPNGEIEVKIGSESFYKPTVDTPDRDRVTINTSETEHPSTHARPVYSMASSVATTETSGWEKNMYYGLSMNITKDLISLPIPNGKSEEIHVIEPPLDVEQKKKIGVYDTGSVSVTNEDMAITLRNSDYTPIYNPYTYNLSGTKTSNNEKLFSSSMMIVQWCRAFMDYKSRGVFSTDLKISSIKYEGNDHGAESKVTFSEIKEPPGDYNSHANFIIGGSYDGLSSTGNRWTSAGDGKVARGVSNIYLGGITQTYQMQSTEVNVLVRWNANSFEYDLSRDLWLQDPSTFQAAKSRYGVGKTKNHPSMTPNTQSNLESEYTWYRTPEEAESHGKISAVKFSYSKSGVFGNWSGVPVKVIGPVGGKDQYGNPNVCLINAFWYKSTGELEGQFPHNDHPTYVASTFDAQGNKTGGHNQLYGDTIYIKSFGITTTTTPEKPVYKTNEEVKWKVVGNLLTDANENYVVRLTTTLPAGLSYDYGSSTDSRGSPLVEGRDITVVNNSNGTTTLIWTLEGLNPANGDIAEVNFSTTPVLKNLSFNTASIASARVVTGGEIWLQDNPSISDTTNASLRSSAGVVNLYQMQQIVLTKEVDKSLIEVGNKDDALSEPDQKSLTDITYKISLENYSSDKLLNVKVVDELPYDGDDFGTDFDGSYTVKEIKITDGNGDITYSNDPVTPVSPIRGIDDPNKIGGVWGGYVPGVSNADSIKNAKAFLVSAKELAVGDKLVFEVTISPNGQKAGNIYRNRAAFNSEIDLPVRSNIVQTQVLGRDLSGYVWYDDDYNGLIDSGEEPVGDIPVKLYRTSLVNGTYVKELVKQSLTGQQFIDGAEDSLVKTTATGSDKGRYKFENLPEGDYLAEFMVGDIVHVQKIAIVTHPLRGSEPDPTKDPLNSKADPNTFKTPEYTHSVLADLPTQLTGADKVSHITDINAGLTRLSKIRLFKYDESSVVDSNGNGKLDPEEIEAATKPLADAEFELFEGADSTDPADSLGKATTDENGWLEFPGLPKGKYTLVETKAPPGYELLKEPITNIDIPEYNYITTVHVADKGHTKLPFTGSTKAMRIILISAACLLVIGMTGVFLHFRPIKVRGGN